MSSDSPFLFSGENRGSRSIGPAATVCPLTAPPNGRWDRTMPTSSDPCEPETLMSLDGGLVLPAKGSEGCSAGSPSWAHSRDRVAAISAGRRLPHRIAADFEGGRGGALVRRQGPRLRARRRDQMRLPREELSPRLAGHRRRTLRYRRRRRPRPVRGTRQRGSRRQGRIGGRALAVPKRRARPLGRRLRAFGPPPHRLGAGRGRVRLRRRRRPRPLRRPARPRHPLAEPGGRDVPRRDRPPVFPTTNGASPPPGATTTATGGPTSTSPIT